MRRASSTRAAASQPLRRSRFALPQCCDAALSNCLPDRLDHHPRRGATASVVQLVPQPIEREVAVPQLSQPSEALWVNVDYVGPTGVVRRFQRGHAGPSCGWPDRTIRQSQLIEINPIRAQLRDYRFANIVRGTEKLTAGSLVNSLSDERWTANDELIDAAQMRSTMNTGVHGETVSLARRKAPVVSPQSIDRC